MKTKFYVPCVVILIAIIAFSYAYAVQNPTIVVTIQGMLSVAPDSSGVPGNVQLWDQNTSITVIKWPQTASGKVDLSPTYAFNKTRNNPVQFAVYFYLDNNNNTVLTQNLITTGDYSATVSSVFGNIQRGMHNLTIVLSILGYPENENQFTESIMIP